MFADSLDENVRYYAAQHRQTPIRVLAELLSDEDATIAHTARVNEALTPTAVEDAVRARHALPNALDLSDFPLDTLLRYLTSEESPVAP